MCIVKKTNNEIMKYLKVQLFLEIFLSDFSVYLWGNIQITSMPETIYNNCEIVNPNQYQHKDSNSKVEFYISSFKRVMDFYFSKFHSTMIKRVINR